MCAFVSILQSVFLLEFESVVLYIVFADDAFTLFFLAVSRIEVIPKSFIYQPNSQVVLPCIVAGAPYPTITWRKVTLIM